MTEPALSEANRRVQQAAAGAGLTISIDLSTAPTRTAEEAAAARGCAVGQIVKSLIFKGRDSGRPMLLLVSGANRVDEGSVAEHVGEGLVRPDAAFVREVTGYAIGGIPPFGHKTQLLAFLDSDLMAFETIYAAAGTPNSTFAIEPKALQGATGATIIAMK